MKKRELKRVKIKEYPRFNLYEVYIVENVITNSGTETILTFVYRECENKIGGNYDRK